MAHGALCRSDETFNPLRRSIWPLSPTWQLGDRAPVLPPRISPKPSIVHVQPLDREPRSAEKTRLVMNDHGARSNMAQNARLVVIARREHECWNETRFFVRERCSGIVPRMLAIQFGRFSKDSRSDDCAAAAARGLCWPVQASTCQVGGIPARRGLYKWPIKRHAEGRGLTWSRRAPGEVSRKTV